MTIRDCGQPNTSARDGWPRVGLPDAQAVQAATPADRDRYVDALRVASLFVVAIGHWMMGGVSQSGEITNTLAVLPWLQPITWVFQVMALFFVVGGVAHAHALSRHLVSGRHAGSYATFIRVRALRLLRPAAVFAGVWLSVGVLFHVMGLLAGQSPSTALAATVLRITTQLLWFLGVYVAVVALAPLMFGLHRRYGVSVVIALVAIAVVVDVLRLTWNPVVGALNFAAVWLAIHQLGFCWKDGLLNRVNGVWLAGISGLSLVVLVVVGPYPVSMVGMPGEALSNMNPPTLALLCQGFMLAGLAVWARPFGEQLLARPSAWRTVVVGASVAMSVYLWHLTALFVLIAGLRWADINLPQVGSLTWWVTRPVWLAALVAITAGLVTIFRRFDKATKPAACPPQRWRDRVAAVGIVVVSVGIFMIAVTGVDVLSNNTSHILGAPVTPLLAVMTMLVGAATLWVSGLAGKETATTTKV